MATDPLNVGRRTDLQGISQDVREIKQAMVLGAAARNQCSGNVPARYQIYPLKSWVAVFAQLPAPSDAGVGGRVICTDITDDEFAAGWNGVVTMGGGTNKAPLWSDGEKWIID